jgi:hypothetical protein
MKQLSSQKAVRRHDGLSLTGRGLGDTIFGCKIPSSGNSRVVMEQVAGDETELTSKELSIDKRKCARRLRSKPVQSVLYLAVKFNPSEAQRNSTNAFWPLGSGKR